MSLSFPLMSNFSILQHKFIDDNEITKTSFEMMETERDISYNHLDDSTLLREQMKLWIEKRISQPIYTMRDETFETWQPLYVLYPMIVYGLENEIDYEKFRQNSIELLRNHLTTRYCGWSGFIHAYPTMVPLYGNIILLGLLDSEEAYSMVDQKAFYDFLMSCKNPDGSFSQYPGGETDLRSTFAALFIAWIINIITPELAAGLVEFTASCQNYEGGFSPVPDCEAHGGFTYCGIGIMHILNRMDAININKAIRYIADRQVPYAGGFCGRTNKLVDSCYSWWLGSPARTISNHLNIEPFWDDDAMREYILRACQMTTGGLRDRPPHITDPFHSLFGSAGLAISANLDGLGDIPTIESVSAIPIERFNHIKSYFERKPFTP